MQPNVSTTIDVLKEWIGGTKWVNFPMLTLAHAMFYSLKKLFGTVAINTYENALCICSHDAALTTL